MIGAGKPIDTRPLLRRLHQLARQSASARRARPRSTRARAGPIGIAFPEVVARGRRARRLRGAAHLGIERVACVGRPVDGRHDRARVRVPVSRRGAQHRVRSRRDAPLPFAIALRSLQREIVRNDPAWRGGNYERGRGPRQRHAPRAQARHDHVPLARGMGPALRPRRVPETHGPARRFPSRSSKSKRTSSTRRSGSPTSFDANCYLYLSRAMDQFDLAEHGGGSLDAAFAKFSVCSVRWSSASQTDMLLHDRPAARDRRASAQAPGVEVEFHAFPSLQGHDAFLVDMRAFRAGDRRFPERQSSAPAPAGAACASGAQEQRRIHHRAVHAHAPVQVRPGHPAGRARPAPSASPAFTTSPGFTSIAAQVAVHRQHALAVVDEHRVAVEEEIAGFDDAARRRRCGSGVPVGAAMSMPLCGLRGCPLKNASHAVRVSSALLARARSIARSVTRLSV